MKGSNIFQESYFRLGQLTSSTWLSCFLTSALESPSSSAPLQVHLGQGGPPLYTATLYCFIKLLSADIPYPLDYNVLISWIREWSLFSLQTPSRSSAYSSGEDEFHNHHNSSYMNSHQKYNPASENPIQVAPCDGSPSTAQS